MSTVNGFQVGSETLKYNYESLENYNTPEFSTTKTYAVGDYVIYQGKLYKCTTAITTAGSWSSSNWALAVLSDDVSSINNVLNALDDAVNDPVTGLVQKAPVIINSASGEVASFNDGADAMPIKSLVASIEPVQDLHGYDYPWPAGGGKNLADFVNDKNIDSNGTVINSTGSIATVDPIAIESGVTYIAKVFGNATGVIVAVWNGNTMVRRVLQGFDTPLNTDGGDRFYICVYNSENITVESAKAMVVKSTETVTTYSPYSNECPITGHTDMTMTRTGVNIWDEEWDRGYVDPVDGVFNPAHNYVRSKHKFRIDGGKTYYFACSRSGTLGNTGISFYDANGDFISSIVIPVNSAFTAPAKAKMMAFFVPSSWYTGDYANDISINYPSTDTAYHSYTGTTIPITFPTTIYGGSDEVIGGSLESTMGMVDLGTLSWVYANTTNHEFFYAMLPNNPKLPSSISVSANALCSSLKNNSYIAVYNHTEDNIIGINPQHNNRVCVYMASAIGMTVSEFATFVSGIQYCYELAEPIEYTLDGEELTTLYGTNNIWTDVGEVSVEYPADTKLYIANIGGEPDEDMIANDLIPSGKYFMVNNNLYLSTAQIAAGAMIIPGTNCTATNLVEALNALNT